MRISFARSLLLLLLAAGMLPLSGCSLFKKKKVQVPAPPPTVAQQEEKSEPEQKEAESDEKQAEKTPEADKTPEAAAKPKPKPRRAPVAKKPAPAPAAPAAPAPPETTTTAAANPPPRPERIVVADGGTNAPPTSGQLSAGIGHDDASHHRQTTAQLLDSTESNLNNLKRMLTADEQAMVAQIRQFVEQSRKATAEQDLVRAHNLALKAHLLSDELVKR